MAHDVESGLRRSAQRASGEKWTSSSASSPSGSSDEDVGGRSARPKKSPSSGDASAAAKTTTTTASTFSGTSFGRWSLLWPWTTTTNPSPPPPRSTKLDDVASDCKDSVSIRFEDGDDYDGGEGGRELVSLAAFKGHLRSAADDFVRRRRRRTRRLLLLFSLAILLSLVFAALAVLVSAPWWLSSTVLRPPRTQEVPFVLLPRAGGSRGENRATSPPEGEPSPEIAPGKTEIVPRIIHQSWKTHDTPRRWDEARRSCSDLHPESRGWEIRLWDDDEARAAVVAAAKRIEAKASEARSFRFSARELVEAYDSYSNPVQRADISRYAALYLHGGVYLDLDVRCERALDSPELGLLSKSVVLPRTWPAGISNDFIVASPESGLLELALRSASGARRATSALLFASSYARVMFSTGPMFLTMVALSWEGRQRELWILPSKLYGKYREDGKTKKETRGGSAGPRTDGAPAAAEGAACDGGGDGDGDGGAKKSKRLRGAGAACGALFTHLHGSSWHGKDAELVAWFGRRRSGGGHVGNGSGGGGAAGGAGGGGGVGGAGAAVVAARKKRLRQQQTQRQQQSQQRQPQQQQQVLQLQHEHRRPSSKKQHQQLQRPFGFIGAKAKMTKKSTAATERGQKLF